MQRLGSGCLTLSCCRALPTLRNSKRFLAIAVSSAPEQQNLEASTSSLASSAKASSQNARNIQSRSSALELLRSQPSHYVVASIYQRRYLLTPRDLLTVTRLKDVKVGDIINLDSIHEVGSRDYTLQASEGSHLAKDLVNCTATVVEHTKGRLEETVKFKKRKGYKKTIKTKPKYTRLRIGDIVLGNGQLGASAGSS